MTATTTTTTEALRNMSQIEFEIVENEEKMNKYSKPNERSERKGAQNRYSRIRQVAGLEDSFTRGQTVLYLHMQQCDNISLN